MFLLYANKLWIKKARNTSHVISLTWAQFSRHNIDKYVINGEFEMERINNKTLFYHTQKENLEKQ